MLQPSASFPLRLVSCFRQSEVWRHWLGSSITSMKVQIHRETTNTPFINSTVKLSKSFQCHWCAMCHVSFVFCWQIRYSYHGQELTQTVPKSWPPSSGCSSWARYHVLSACRLKYWYFWYTLVILSVRFYRCQMIFSFCFQGGEEQHSILLATTGDRWRQSGLDRPDSTVIFAFFHIRSFAVPREVCMIVGFHWFSTFLPGWGSFAGIWRARHVVSKCKTHVTCSLFCDR